MVLLAHKCLLDLLKICERILVSQDSEASKRLKMIQLNIFIYTYILIYRCNIRVYGLCIVCTADLKMRYYKISNIQGGCGIDCKSFPEGLPILESGVA